MVTHTHTHTRTHTHTHTHTHTSAVNLTNNVRLRPEYGIQVSSVYHTYASMQAPTYTHTQSRAENLTNNIRLWPKYGIQVSSASMQAPTHTHMTKPVAVKLRCNATALIVVMLWFYVSPTAKIIRRRVLGLKSHPKDRPASVIIEPRNEKTNILHMQKQRRRSTSR